MPNTIELPWYSQLFVYVVYIIGILFGYIYELIEFVKKLKQKRRTNPKVRPEFVDVTQWNIQSSKKFISFAVFV